MFFEAVAIEQTFSLENAATRSAIRFRLPNNEELVLPISDDDCRRVIEAAADIGTADSEPVPPQPELESYSAPTLVPWAVLPEELLPTSVKEEFRRMGMPSEMTVGDITFHAQRILSIKQATPMAVAVADEVVAAEEAMIGARAEEVAQSALDVDDETGVPSI